MIRCNMCGDLGEADEMYFVSLYPSFTYLDAVLCETCIKQLQGLIAAGKAIEFEWEDWVKEYKSEHPDNYDSDYDPTDGDCGFYWSGYDEQLDFILHSRAVPYGTDEIICPECGGMAIWDLEDLGEDYGNAVWRCLNCLWWSYIT